MEFAVDLGSVLRWGNQTVSCLWPVSKVQPEQATKAQRGNLGARCRWAVNATPRSLYPEKDPVPIVQEAGWAPGPIWMGGETLAPNGIRSPDRQARSESLYRLRFRGTRLWPPTNAIPYKNTLYWSAVVLCACELTKLLPVVFFCVVRALHKFDLRLIMKETPTKWRPVERWPCINTDTCFWHDPYASPPTVVVDFRNPTRSVQLNCILVWTDGSTSFCWSHPYSTPYLSSVDQN
jgi:hypothetical protein